LKSDFERRVAVGDELAHVIARNCREGTLDHVLVNDRLVIAQAVQPLALVVILDDSKAFFDWVILRRVGNVENWCDTQLVHLTLHGDAEVNRQPIHEEAEWAMVHLT
jgi:hypothetical protein